MIKKVSYPFLLSLAMQLVASNIVLAQGIDIKASSDCQNEICAGKKGYAYVGDLRLEPGESISLKFNDNNNLRVNFDGIDYYLMGYLPINLEYATRDESGKLRKEIRIEEAGDELLVFNDRRIIPESFLNNESFQQNIDRIGLKHDLVYSTYGRKIKDYQNVKVRILGYDTAMITGHPPTIKRGEKITKRALYAHLLILNDPEPKPASKNPDDDLYLNYDLPKNCYRAECRGKRGYISVGILTIEKDPDERFALNYKINIKGVDYYLNRYLALNVENSFIEKDGSSHNLARVEEVGETLTLDDDRLFISEDHYLKETLQEHLDRVAKYIDLVENPYGYRLFVDHNIKVKILGYEAARVTGIPRNETKEVSELKLYAYVEILTAPIPSFLND